MIHEIIPNSSTILSKQPDYITFKKGFYLKSNDNHKIIIKEVKHKSKLD